jgi:hypothetical protein
MGGGHDLSNIVPDGCECVRVTPSQYQRLVIESRTEMRIIAEHRRPLVSMAEEQPRDP